MKTPHLTTGAVGTTKHIHPHIPDVASTLARLDLCPGQCPPTQVYGGIGISIHPVTCPPVD